MWGNMTRRMRLAEQLAFTIVNNWKETKAIKVTEETPCKTSAGVLLSVIKQIT